ncbi:hypothetical protein Ate01nite_66750 [Actinoplanes teichomyceticus]|nr:hypothetical protein Ate01nite_66750 [Actinoplanes teichomyceticus]
MAGPATAIGTSCTDERTEGQANAVSSTLTITVSRATTPATFGQGDGAGAMGRVCVDMTTPLKTNDCSF